jgi:hypothetical protein
MDANSGEPWSEMDIADLTHSLAYGNTIADAASLLCRDEDEVRKRRRNWGWKSTQASGGRSLKPAPNCDQQDHHRRDRGASEGDGAALFKLAHSPLPGPLEPEVSLMGWRRLGCSRVALR